MHRTATAIIATTVSTVIGITTVAIATAIMTMTGTTIAMAVRMSGRPFNEVIRMACARVAKPSTIGVIATTDRTEITVAIMETTMATMAITAIIRGPSRPISQGSTADIRKR